MSHNILDSFKTRAGFTVELIYDSESDKYLVQTWKIAFPTEGYWRDRFTYSSKDLSRAKKEFERWRK